MMSQGETLVPKLEDQKATAVEEKVCSKFQLRYYLRNNLGHRNRS